MKSIFRIAAPLLAATALASCGRSADPPGAAGPIAPDGGDAQRLVTILDYVGADYGRAVQGGQIVSPEEYDEQIQFVSAARQLAAGLTGGAPGDPLVQGVADVGARVAARAGDADVARACRTTRDHAVARFGLRTAPTSAPSLARAAELYAQSCAACHGVRGDGDTEQARQLEPAPARFREPGRLDALSPHHVYNTLTFGIPGTAMAAFDSLSAGDRWNLAFYVFRLGHEPVGGPPPAVELADQAAKSDAELAEVLRRAGQPEPKTALARLRREGPFQEPPVTAAVARARRLVREAAEAGQSGRPRDGARLVLDAYLQAFEPVEPRLRARDADGTAAAEAGFHALRAALDAGDAGETRRRAAALDARLGTLAEERRSGLPLLAALVIYFREGVEAALLVGALLAGVRRLGRPEARRWVHAGWLAALPAGLATWWLSGHVLNLTAASRELTEAVVSLLAAGVLFSMSFWMISKVEARRWTGYLRRGLEESLGRGNLALLAGVSFLAVYREAAETVLFTQAVLLENPGAEAAVWAGAGLGSLAVLVVSLAMQRTVVRLPMSTFFAVSGALLCALAISFAGSGLFELVSAGYLRPRPVPIPEVSWMGIHPDLTPLAAQLAILTIVAVAALVTLRRRPATAVAPERRG
jgi:high-affinity iron transporter